MKKALNLILLVTSLFAYLEWGGGNHTFLFQAEMEVMKLLFSKPGSAVHPFTVIPMLGQLILLFTLFQKQPGKWLTYTGLGCIGLLLLFIFIIGIMGLNYKIILSATPFIITAIITIRVHSRKTVKE